MKNIRFILLLIFAFVCAQTSGQTIYSNGFETGITPGWDAFGSPFNPTRVASGTNGITSSSGGWHAELSASGNAATNFGAYRSVFPCDGYQTSVDVYLDVANPSWANDTRFDYTSAINNNTGSHRRDFVFNVGFYNDATSPGTGNRFVISASNNSGRANAYPKNPARSPQVITASGWYTFEHNFYNNAGTIACDLTVYDATNVAVATWTLSNAGDLIGIIGGNRYGWFLNCEFSVLAIDNSALTAAASSVHNLNTSKDYCSIQAAIDDPLTLNGHTITVDPGTYTENVNITKGITLQGSNNGVSCSGARGAESIITAATAASGSKSITISADGVSIDGFTITNPLGSFGIYAKGRSNTSIENNIITDIGNNVSGSSPTYGVAIEMGATAHINNVQITNNCVNNLRGGQNTTLTGAAAKSNNGSAVAIGFGFSTANFDISNGVISNNIISNITSCIDPFASGGKGAYGVLINVGANNANAGKANGAIVQANEISYLDGLWSHAIGLEGETPGAQVLNNTISNLTEHKGTGDAVGVLLEDNIGSGSVSINENSFTNVAYGVANGTPTTVNATCNWYGFSNLDSVSSKNIGAVSFIPFLTSGTDTSSAVGFQPGEACSVCNTVAGITNNTGSTLLNCITSSISVTATGGTTYLWNGGATPTTANNTFTSPGTYIVVVSNANGCSDSINIVITQDNSVPNAPTGTDVTVCFDGNAHTGMATAASGESIVWYDAATGGSIISVPSGTSPGVYAGYAAAQNNVSGCESATRTLVTVTINNLPTVTISQSLLPDFCQGGVIILTATATGGAPFNYLWSNSATTQNTEVNASGTYTVTVTNNDGCSAQSSETVSYSQTDLLSSYTILATDDVKLEKETAVFAGGVGSTDSKGKVEVKDNSTITASSTFAKAKSINIHSGSAITNQYAGTEVSVTLPSFVYNPNCSSKNDLKVKKNTTVTISGSIFGKIEIEDGAHVTFTSSAIYAEKFESDKDATIEFAGCTQIYLCKDLKIDENNMFNATSKNVIVYAEKKVEIKKGTILNATIYALEDLDSKADKDKRNVLTGMFIAKKVTADYTDFNWNTNCTPCVAPSMKKLPEVLATTSELTEFVNIYPNPTTSVATVSINAPQVEGPVTVSLMDVNGQTLFSTKQAQFTGNAQIPLNLSTFAVGMYFVKVQYGSTIKMLKLQHIN